MTRTLVVVAIIWANAVSHTVFDPAGWLPLQTEVIQGTPVPAK